MRNPGTVYKKLREVKHHHVVALYKKHLERIPENCKYNELYRFTDEDNKIHIVRLCMIHQPDDGSVIPHLLDACEQKHHCENCNGFVPKYTKQQIKEMFQESLENKKIRSEKYPDICALEWVLEKSVPGIPPFNWIQKVYYSIKRYLLKRGGIL